MGLVNGLIQVIFFVPVHRRFGTRAILTVGICSFGFIFAVFPFIERSYIQNGHELGFSAYALIGVQIALCPIENMAFSEYTLSLRYQQRLIKYPKRRYILIRSSIITFERNTWCYQWYCPDCCLDRTCDWPSWCYFFIRILHEQQGCCRRHSCLLGSWSCNSHRCGCV